MALPHGVPPPARGPTVLSHLSSHIHVIQEQVVVSPTSRLKEVRGLEVKDHMAQLVPNPDSLTPAWPPPRPHHWAVF